MTRSAHFLAAAWILAGGLFCATPAPAEEPPDRWEGGVLGGFVAIDSDMGGPDHDTIEPTLGGRIGFQWRPRWQLFGDLLLTDFDTDTFRDDVSGYTARGGVELTFASGRDTTWFVQGAGGYTELRSDAPTVWSGVASVATGQRIPVANGRSLRWELRVDGWLAEDGLEGNDIVETRFVMGWSWGGGAKQASGSRDRDADDDGVRDRRDRCADTPAGTTVDRRGCPVEAGGAESAAGVAAAPAPVLPPTPARDLDEDGVADADDDCPKTLRGFEVDERGCPLDVDQDGVYDGLGMDKCLGTPPGVPVDVHGCPVKDDDDGR